MKNRFLLAAIVVVIAACGEATSPTDELSAARDRWETWGHTSYDLIVQRGPCECLPEATEAIVVAVRGSSLSRYHLDDQQPVVESYLQYPPVPGLFDLIASEIANGETVEVKYDAQTGVPLQIDVNPQDFPVDGGYALRIELRFPPAS